MNVHKQRLEQLRHRLNEQSLAGFIVPLTDEHQSEYVPVNAQRLPWLTNFNGSFGVAAVLMDTACVVSDGRYTIQIKEEVDGNLFDRLNIADQTHLDWIISHAKSGDVIGFDPWLHTAQWIAMARKKLASKGIDLKAVDENPIDHIWEDQPAEPANPINIHPEKYAGESAASKRQRIAAELQEEGADCVVMSLLDSIAWTFNIRSSDVKHTPVSIAYALVHKDGTADLFLAPSKITDDLREGLGKDVTLYEKPSIIDSLKALGSANKTVLIDDATASEAVYSLLNNAGAIVIKGKDPAVYMKAIKNQAEQQGAINAHVRDGVAVTKFLHWFAQQAPKGDLYELDVVAKILQYREEDELLRDISFRTISGAGPNAALAHYSVNEKSNRRIEKDSVFLVDSGGQYLDGTTDITRTLAVGDAGEDARRFHTLVLKGHIALATTKFPKGTTGPALDTIARHPLWQAGLDYDHGTGHGVGAFLGVHEGPGRISKGFNDVALVPGMIFSNEPGYYLADHFGFRQENLELVIPVEIDGGEREMYGFKPLTMAPIDKNLLTIDLLNEDEKQWLNKYHQNVFDTLSPYLEGDVLAWLKNVTSPV